MKKYNVLIGACLLLSVTTTWAGNSGIGGGDICEDRIKVVRDDINDWIVKGGPKELALPNGITAEQYSLSMLKALVDTRDIKCVSKGDQGFPVTVNGTPKVCIFDQTVGSITCDFAKFNSMSESDQYVLIHHEYAGLSDIERPQGADSNYSVSNQISGFLADHVVKRLTLKKLQLPPYEDFARNYDGSLKYMTHWQAGAYCASLGMHLPSAREFALLATISGAKGISAVAKEGYLRTSAINYDGKTDIFYYNKSEYTPAASDLGKEGFWSSSLSAVTPGWAIVFAGETGIIGKVSVEPHHVGAVVCLAGP